MPKEPSPQTELPRSSAPLDATIAEVVDRDLKTGVDHAEGLHFDSLDGTILWANQTDSIYFHHHLVKRAIASD